LKALMTNPLIGDYDTAKPLLGALLDANRDHLPRFFPGR
jgi:alpha-galactosidase/6-phospho-beta-glucosidase family protein